MKKTYTGLTTRRITVGCQPLMQNSKVNLKAKTKAQEWHEDGESEIFGLDNELSGTLVIEDD